MHYFSMTDGLCQRNWNILHKVYAIYVAFSSVQYIYILNESLTLYIRRAIL